MLNQRKIYFVLLCIIAPSSCDSYINKIHNEYLEKVININGIKNKIANFVDDDLWILKMIDASTKIPNGILDGNPFDLGNFDECYNIKYQDIYGKYCLGVIPMNVNTNKFYEAFGKNYTKRKTGLMLHPDPRLLTIPDFVGIHFAICVPHMIPASEIPGLLSYREDFCYSKATEPELSTGAIIVTCVLSLFAFVIIISTLFDIFLYYTDKKIPHELTIAFSFLSNGRKIIQSTTNPDQLLCLNGIRAISMMWVILGHEYSNILNAPLTNFNYVQEFQTITANYFVNGATVSVDTFFVCGGLVTVYTFMKSVDKNIQFNILPYYIHRYLRLTPAFIIMSLIQLYLIQYMNTAPLWATVDELLIKPCERGWWSSFLYITNYVQDGLCLPQTWYLSVDMQLFILSPLILIPMTKWKKPTLLLLYFLAIMGCVIPFIVGFTEDLQEQFSDNYMQNYYTQTYTRFGPYVIGMILGYYIYHIKKSKLTIKLNMVEATFAWLICLTGLTACVYAGAALDQTDKWANSLFLAFNRNGWALFLSGVIFLCVSGNGGPVDIFLSIPIFQFLTKLSYSMYLVHYSIVIMRYASMKNIMAMSNLTVMHAFWGDFMFTLFFSIFLCLSFESPVIILEKHLFRRGEPKRAVNTCTEEKQPV